MVRVGAEAKILLKIAKLVESIRSKLLDAGFNHKEVSSFFSIRIFKGKASSESAIDGHQTLNDQLMGVITRAKENKSSLEKILLDILEKLQIENGFIEEYENYEPESLPPVKVDKRKSSEDSVEEAPQRQRNFLSSWQKMFDSSTSASPSPKVVPRMNQLMNIERELSESLFKTKVLKKIIQQRLVEDIEDTYNSRIKHIHELLALEGSC